MKVVDRLGVPLSLHFQYLRKLSVHAGNHRGDIPLCEITKHTRAVQEGEQVEKGQKRDQPPVKSPHYPALLLWCVSWVQAAARQLTLELLAGVVVPIVLEIR